MSEKRIDEMTLADYRRAFENMERKRRPDPEPETFMGIDLAKGADVTAIWHTGFGSQGVSVAGVRFPRA